MKQFIALFIVFTMLFSISPSVAADDMTIRPTVEEILSEYHQKAFESETATAAACSSRAGSGERTLEQETVDALNAAGYEAYNVTSENYETLENQLQTDFADMGLDPDGSYIITLHGDDSENSTANGISPRAAFPAPDLGGSNTFTYTYNGTTYTMRYVTVTSNDDPYYCKTSTYDLLSNYFDSFLDRLLEAGATAYLDALDKRIPIGTIVSLFGLSDYLNRYKTTNSILEYMAGTQWTRTYIQVWDTYYEDWINASCTEYADMKSKISGYLYDSRIVGLIDIGKKDVDKTEYSHNYFNYEQRKLQAVIGFTSNSIQYDVVGDVIYTHGDTIVAYHS